MKARLAFCLTILLSFGAHADDGSGKIIIFGDSLSDPGNFYIETGLTTTAPYTMPIPIAPYDVKGFRVTNGKTWAERLAGELGDGKSGKPALERPGFLTNYAFARARARPRVVLPGFPPPPVTFFDLTTQVDQFLADFGGQAPSDALYVIWIGSLDLFDALSDPANAGTIIGQALGTTASQIIKLYSRGARNFLIPNLPNLGATPAVTISGDPDLAALARQASIGYNIELENVLFSLDAFPGIHIVRLDVFAIVDEIIASPKAFGFNNVEDSCIQFFPPPMPDEDQICDRPNKYLFWDFIHPTKRAHQVLSHRAEDVLEEALDIDFSKH